MKKTYESYLMICKGLYKYLVVFFEGNVSICFYFVVLIEDIAKCFIRPQS